MSKINTKIGLELVWWAITFMVCIIVLLPIYTSIGGDYRFYIENVVSIVVFITLARWIFLLRHTFFGWNKKIKLGLIFVMIPLFFICYDNIIDFQLFIDEEDIMTMLTKLEPEDQHKMAKYIKYEYIFFATGALISIFLLPFRMVLSLWRQINKGTV